MVGFLTTVFKDHYDVIKSVGDVQPRLAEVEGVLVLPHGCRKSVILVNLPEGHGENLHHDLIHLAGHVVVEIHRLVSVNGVGIKGVLGGRR